MLTMTFGVRAAIIFYIWEVSAIFIPFFERNYCEHKNSAYKILTDYKKVRC